MTTEQSGLDHRHLLTGPYIRIKEAEDQLMIHVYSQAQYIRLAHQNESQRNNSKIIIH